MNEFMKERIPVIDDEEHIRRMHWTPPWSAAAWRRYGLDRASSITKRRQAAALQGGAR